MRGLAFFLLCFCFSILLPAQIDVPDKGEKHFHSDCLTPDISYNDWIEGLDMKNVVINKNNVVTQLPVRIHIVNRTNGTGGLALSTLNQAMANLNNKYLEADIEWFIADINYINNDTYYDFDQTEETALCQPNVVDDAVNVFFVNSINGGGICGYAYYPFNNDQSLRILMRNSCAVNAANGTFVHEFGHHLSLPHTHNGTSSGPNAANAENVPRTGPQANCDTHGDYICDTEADPTGPTSNCVYTGGGSDENGVPYTPNEDNIMSYYSDACGGIFTPGQYTAIGVGLTARQGHTAYDIDGASPMSVADPSSLTAVDNQVYVTLNWTDNASNEYGYIIERSDDNGVTFQAIPFGGVGPNVTSFDDYDILPNISYQYRVKASNDDPDHYSNVATFNSTEYCTTVDLEFNGTGQSAGLISTPATITGLPLTLPTCQTDAPVGIQVIGDFGADFEICDILGEDNTTILTATNTSSTDCHYLGGITNFIVSQVQYDLWAANGQMTFYLDGNINVNDICNTQTFTVCMSLESCGGGGNCPNDYAGPNMLTGTQSVSEVFDTDGMIQTDQDIMNNSSVTYDSATAVEFLPGFSNILGTTLQVMLNGCN